ncbi:unnamed protein product, partial [Brenthis ino]
MTRLTIAVVIMMLFLDCIYTARIQRSFDPVTSEDVLTVKKRPFCNAFTGCGRKRSQDRFNMPLQETYRQRQFVEDGPLPDIEPALDELPQLIVDAKLWDVLRDEISRRRSLYN